MSGLFRVEVLQHRRRDWLGSIQLNRPVSLTVLTVGVVLLLLSAALFLAVGEYTRKAHLAGWLVEGPVRTGVVAHLVVPSKTVASLRTGQLAQLRYPAFGGRQVARASGQVLQVARSPSPSGLPQGSASGRDEPVFYGVTVRVDSDSVVADGAVHALVPGMQVDAVVFLERRRLIEWLFLPLLPFVKFAPASGVAAPG